MSVRARRLALAGLSTAGFLDSLYMLAYDEGLIGSLLCPFFGEGCERVGRSEHARHYGIPNAAVGAVGYATMAALALWDGTLPARRRRRRSLLLGGIAAAAAAASAYLTYEQKAKVGAWCFWCWTSAAINVSALPLALAEAREAWTGRGAVVAGDRPLPSRKGHWPLIA